VWCLAVCSGAVGRLVNSSVRTNRAAVNMVHVSFPLLFMQAGLEEERACRLQVAPRAGIKA
jgi:hypothetical protein